MAARLSEKQRTTVFERLNKEPGWVWSQIIKNGADFSMVMAGLPEEQRTTVFERLNKEPDGVWSQIIQNSDDFFRVMAARLSEEQRTTVFDCLNKGVWSQIIQNSDDFFRVMPARLSEKQCQKLSQDLSQEKAIQTFYHSRDSLFCSVTSQKTTQSSECIEGEPLAQIDSNNPINNLGL